MVGGSGSSVGSVTKQSVTTKKTAAASQGRRKTAVSAGQDLADEKRPRTDLLTQLAALIP